MRNVLENKLWFYVHVLSLDICLGVLGSGALATIVTGAKMKTVWWFLLPLSVWVIYTLDHLLDGKKVGENSINPRHKFHYDHSKILTILCTIAAIISAVLAFLLLREIVLLGGVLLAALAVLHLGIARWGKIRFGKEFSVALIYTLGVWFGPLLIVGFRSWTSPILLFLFFLGTVLNLVMNSLMEAELDAKEGQVYLLGVLSPKLAKEWVLRLSLLGFLAALVLAGGIRKWAPGTSVSASLVIALICAVPGGILRYADKFQDSQKYRILGEGVFILGLIPWFLNSF
ncbi:LA_0991 family prenyltransferase-like protein [Leptospira andrefontaineae]|uniref:Prenyltransferase n=1 Tax=Leptospira andrefontaineae TaxID=2484976 RepID=A0A4R9HCV7_9LEPT|nr:prenyltransferase [Leptospira andrefontaineae]TGK44652.1 prenyltransferase [Leptospira andrefontaineae]